MENKNKVLTEGALERILSEEMGKMAIMIQKGFEETRGDLEGFKKEINERVAHLEQNIGKEFKGVHNLFDTVFQELKDIREQLAKADTQAEMVDLEMRVGKIERKLRLKL